MNYLESTFQTLISAPTVTGNYAENEKALDFIESFVEARGMHVTRFLFEEYGALVATVKPSYKTPKIMLMAHLDVVEGSEGLFTLRKEDGRYYGRGVLDMKAAIAVYLQLVDEIKDDISQYDIGIMITTDEEAGGSSVEKLLENGYLPSVAILPDGGDDWQVQLYSKGFLRINLTAKGVTAHGSRPWLGDGAIMRLVEGLRHIQTIFPEPNPDVSTLNIGLISGGVAVNQIPEHAEAGLDIRVASEQERENILEQMSMICGRYDIDMDILINGAVGEFSLDDPYISKFAEIVKKVTDVTVIGSRTLGSNDARFFMPHNIPCISFYPPGGGHHGPQEWVSEKGVADMHVILREYIERVARI